MKQCRSRFSLNIKQRGLFRIHEYLDKLSIHLVKESVNLTVCLGISKTMPLATMLGIEKLTTLSMTCMWT